MSKAQKILVSIIAICLIVFGASLFLNYRTQEYTASLYLPATSKYNKNLGDFNTEILSDSAAQWQQVLAEMPGPTTSLKTEIHGNLAEIFNDSNYIHWRDAEKIGIAPLWGLRSHYNPGRDLVKIASCEDYFLEPLTHSAPYLVPEGAEMLHEIGRRFNDSLASRGGGSYRIRVTSVLRTPSNVAKLKRNNKNAIDSSVHQLGTTVDITYSRFACYAAKPPYRSAEDLKNLLGEVLLAMREEGKIWVKYERQQPCYHITVRPKP